MQKETEKGNRHRNRENGKDTDNGTYGYTAAECRRVMYAAVSQDGSACAAVLADGTERLFGMKKSRGRVTLSAMGFREYFREDSFGRFAYGQAEYLPDGDRDFTRFRLFVRYTDVFLMYHLSRGKYPANRAERITALIMRSGAQTVTHGLFIGSGGKPYQADLTAVCPAGGTPHCICADSCSQKFHSGRDTARDTAKQKACAEADIPFFVFGAEDYAPAYRGTVSGFFGMKDHGLSDSGYASPDRTIASAACCAFRSFVSYAKYSGLTEPAEEITEDIGRDAETFSVTEWLKTHSPVTGEERKPGAAHRKGAAEACAMFDGAPLREYVPHPERHRQTLPAVPGTRSAAARTEKAAGKKTKKTQKPEETSE